MATYTPLSTKIELTGDFFTHDPGKTLYKNIAEMLDGLAEEMQDAARGAIAQAEGSMPYSIGWTQAHTFGYTTSGRTGKRWATWAAVGIPTTGMDKKTAIRTKAAGASIENRFHVFRRVKSAVYRMRSLLSANLTKGLE